MSINDDIYNKLSNYNGSLNDKICSYLKGRGYSGDTFNDLFDSWSNSTGLEKTFKSFVDSAEIFLAELGYADFPAGADYRRGLYWLPSLSAGDIATESADEIKRSVQFVSEAEWFSQFTRSSTALTQAVDGSFASVGVDAPRFDYALGRRALLIEGARTRLNADADNIGGAAWALVGTGSTRTALTNKIGLTRFAIASGGANWHRVINPQPTTSGSPIAITVIYEAGTSGRMRVVCRTEPVESVVYGPIGNLSVLGVNAGNISIASDASLDDGVRMLKLIWTPNASAEFGVSIGVGPDSATVGETVNVLYMGWEQASFASANPILGASANTTRAIETMRLHPKVEALLARDDWSALVRGRAIGNVADAPFLGGDASSAIIRSDNAGANIASQSAASAELTITANNAADFAALLANTGSSGKLLSANGAHASDADDFGAVNQVYAGRDGAGLSSFARHDLHLFGPSALASAAANALTATGWGA